MKLLKSLSCVFMIMATPFLANAHPGHGDHGGYTITHYFTEPEHIALLVLVIAAIVYFVVRGKKKTSEK